MKTLFIYNPNAGKKQIKSFLYDILNILAKSNDTFTILPTRKTKEAISYLKKNAGKYDKVICSGGDGTLNETVNGLLLSNNNHLPLTYLPAGSTNDFASSLKIPKEMNKAAEVYLKNKYKQIDIGKFNSRYFTYIAAFGAFTSVAYSTPQEIKNILGHVAYLIEGVKSLSDIRSVNVSVSANEYNETTDYIYGMITNTYSVGGIYKFDRKKVKLDDGLLEVMLVKKPKSILELNDIINYFLGIKKETPMVITFKTSKITFSSLEKLSWTLDGEDGGSLNKVSIKCLSKAISINCL